MEESTRISNPRHPWTAGPTHGRFQGGGRNRPQPMRVSVARAGSRLGQLFSLASIIDLPAEGDGLTEPEWQLTLKVHQKLGTMERSGGWLRQPAE